jgi:hypothetical protein
MLLIQSKILKRYILEEVECEKVREIKERKTIFLNV